MIPSNHKWFRNLAVSQILADTMEDMRMYYPKPSVDLAKIRREYHVAVGAGQSRALNKAMMLALNHSVSTIGTGPVRGWVKLAKSTARTPVRKMPSKVPAPPIEATGAPRPCTLLEIRKIGADQDAEAATDIGQRRRILPRDQHRHDRGDDRRREDGHRDADAMHGRG